MEGKSTQLLETIVIKLSEILFKKYIWEDNAGKVSEQQQVREINLFISSFWHIMNQLS